MRPDPPKAAPPVRFGQGPKLANNGDSSSGASYWILSDFRLIYVLASLAHAGQSLAVIGEKRAEWAASLKPETAKEPGEAIGGSSRQK